MNQGRMSTRIDVGAVYPAHGVGGGHTSDPDTFQVELTDNPMVEGTAPRETSPSMSLPQQIKDDIDEMVSHPSLDNFCKMCYDLSLTSWFWALISGFALAEPIVCSFRKPKVLGVNYAAQCLILALSSFMLVLQAFAALHIKRQSDCMAYLDIKNADKDPSKTESVSDSRRNSAKNVTEQIKNYNKNQCLPMNYQDLQQLLDVVTTGALMLETATILGGWVFLYYRPGIASLRCLRVLRILYYHELPSEILYMMEHGWYSRFNPVGFMDFQLIERACKFASGSLTKLGTEMFFLTKATRGGFILLFLLCYISFVVGMAMYGEVYDDPILADPNPRARTSCISIGMCTILMLRLMVYDGSGLDFLTNLSLDHKFLFVVAVIYMALTAFGIFNGLIGIFGGIFAEESKVSFRNGKNIAEDAKTLHLGYSEQALKERKDQHAFSVPTDSAGNWNLLKVDDVVFFHSLWKTGENERNWKDFEDSALRDLVKVHLETLDRSWDSIAEQLPQLAKQKRYEMAAQNSNHRHDDDMTGISVRSSYHCRDRWFKLEPSDEEPEIQARQGEFENLVGKITKVEKHHRGLLDDKGKSLDFLMRRGRDDKKENPPYLQPPADDPEWPAYGITYSVIFKGRDKEESFKVEFKESPFNPFPKSTLLHLKRHKINRQLNKLRTKSYRSERYQPLAGKLELLPILDPIEQRVAAAFNSSSTPSSSSSSSSSSISSSHDDRLGKLEERMELIDQKLDRLLSAMGVGGRTQAYPPPIPADLYPHKP